jgi:hypothetical protein
MLQVPRRKIRKRKYPNEWKHKQRTIIPENFHNLNIFSIEILIENLSGISPNFF